MAEAPTREEWLRLAVLRLHGLPGLDDYVPAWSMFVGPGRWVMGSENQIGWTLLDVDGYTILIDPKLEDPAEVLAVLAHELCHVCVGVDLGHNGAFRTLWRAVGFEGKPTEVSCSEELSNRLDALAASLGPYPPA
jgi:hypothetical protein